MKELTFILTIGFLLTSNQIFGCSCLGQASVKEEIKDSDAVLTGKVISKQLVTLVDSTAVQMFGNDSTNLNRLPFEITVAQYEFLVTSRYKGRITEDTITVYTGLGSGDCGVNFKIGEDYVVYGSKETYFGQVNNDWPFPEGKNIYWTDICTRTTSKNDIEIKEIEKYRRKK